MKLPYPIHPARIHTPGRFCDKPAVKRGVIYLMASAVAVGAVAVAIINNIINN